MPTVKEKPALLKHPELAELKNPVKSPWKLVAFWALAIFMLINIGLFRLETNKKSADLFHGTGSIDLAVNEFKKLPQRPDVVLLGSSLVMFPFWSMDKAKDPVGVGDIFHHHGSKVLEDEMSKSGFSNPHVFSFAIFGQMVSDAYIYVNEFLGKEKAPHYLIYGIAPRDFSDYDLSSPMATNTFKRLVNLDNMLPYMNLYLPGFQDKIEFLMGRCCYFYSHRWRIQQEFNKGVEMAYVALRWHEPVKKIDFSKAGFMMFGGYKERWDSSEQEYVRRYKNIAERDLSVQMGFLKQILEKSNERGTKVILVNMPLTDINRKLLPPGFYDKFRSELAGLAKEKGARYLDLGSSTKFTRWDFWDTAHLGPSGGFKILEQIVPVLNELKQERSN